MSDTPRTVFVFVDGLGLGEPNADTNPLYSGACPRILTLLASQATSIDPRMGVEGKPQSATGQTALFTGVNAAEVMGRHAEGIPRATLKRLIREGNLFSWLKDRGYDATFANCYYVPEELQARFEKLQSVTTVATLHAFGTVRGVDELGKGMAVYQDLTRQILCDRGYETPLIEPEQAAEDLVRLGASNDFTFFEYFQTDLMAHKGSPEDILGVLRRLDAFLGRVHELCREQGLLFVMTSDHGNIEDNRTRSHTMNPIPFVADGPGAALLHEDVKGITDITPALLRLYPG